MGKSPGKWIKTVLFGKKNAKTQYSKGVTPNKRTAAKKTVEDPAGDSLVISNPSPVAITDVENIQLERGSSGTPCVTDALSPVNQDVDPQSDVVTIQLSDAEMQSQEEAAAKVQGAFRGHMARRAFRALKGIIRLQALIRGHLVRRQAVATLRCMQAIVKLQSLARGQKDVKLAGIGAESFFRSEKLATNLFVRKLLISLPTAMPLSLQYDIAEPNSAWNWLERWSLSHLWESPKPAKKSSSSKLQKKPVNSQTIEPDSGKSKRTIRKAPIHMNGDNGDMASAETEKPKRNSKKITQTEPIQENPQNELERVKRSLKKVAASAAVASEKSEIEPENPKLAANSEQEIVIPSEKPAASDIINNEPVLLEVPSRTMAMDELIDIPNGDNPVISTHCSENGEKTENAVILNEELSVKEEESVKESQKVRKRRSLPPKQEYAENISQNSPSVPSYMAATQSAKAKLRAQAAAKMGVEDVAEYNQTRRHSLPALANSSKLTSMSPRIQKPVQANGKGGSKTNKAMTTSRDDKALLPGWRR